jgi:hypothetical protein
MCADRARRSRRRKHCRRHVRTSSRPASRESLRPSDRNSSNFPCFAGRRAHALVSASIPGVRVQQLDEGFAGRLGYGQAVRPLSEPTHVAPGPFQARVAAVCRDRVPHPTCSDPCGYSRGWAVRGHPHPAAAIAAPRKPPGKKRQLRSPPRRVSDENGGLVTLGCAQDLESRVHGSGAAIARV